jgi:hypothetical protein
MLDRNLEHLRIAIAIPKPDLIAIQRTGSTPVAAIVVQKRTACNVRGGTAGCKDAVV